MCKNVKWKLYLLMYFFCCFFGPYPRNGKIQFCGSVALGGLRCWTVKGKTVRGETGGCTGATFPLAFQQLSGLPEGRYLQIPTSHLLQSVFLWYLPLFTVPRFLEASLETLPPPLSILLPPCRWDTFPDFFPKAEWGRVCHLRLTASPDKCQRNNSAWGWKDLQLMAEYF